MQPSEAFSVPPMLLRDRLLGLRIFPTAEKPVNKRVVTVGRPVAGISGDDAADAGEGLDEVRVQGRNGRRQRSLFRSSWLEIRVDVR